MRERATLLAFFILFSVFGFNSAVFAQSWSLITKEEFDREREYSAQMPSTKPPSMVAQPSPQGSAPTIEIQQPDQNKPIKNPVTVIVAFAAAPGSKIDLSSMRILYGWLKLDITSRIRSYAKISETGVRAENAELPPGTHSIVFSISDDKGRTTSRTVTINVI